MNDANDKIRDDDDDGGGGDDVKPLTVTRNEWMIKLRLSKGSRIHYSSDRMQQNQKNINIMRWTVAVYSKMQG